MSFLDDIIDPEKATQHIQQGSDEWDNIRLGRFTSSELWKLMECGKRPMTEAELKARPKSGKGSKTTLVPDPSKMGEKGLTYINQKVAEVLTGKPRPSAYAYPLVYGKEMEPEAVAFYENKIGVTCDETGFHTWTDHAGGTPDRLIGDKEGLEVKCPFDSEKQIQYLMLTDHHDLKRMFPDFYWQCTSLLLFTGRDLWNFVTFDPRMILDKHKMAHIKIFAKDVEEDMDAVNTAIEAAVKEKLQLLNILG